MLYHPELVVYLWFLPLLLWVVAPLLFSSFAMLVRILTGAPAFDTAAERRARRVAG